MLAVSFGGQQGPWMAVGIFLVLIAGFVVSALLASRLLSPRRRGPTKDKPYESGIDPVGEARARVNPHFYLFALMFLLFDVELVFFYPWARLFLSESVPLDQRRVLLAGMGLFALFLLLAYVYAWIKGAFRWPNE